MAQVLTPTTLLDRGEGVADLSAAAVAATSTEIVFPNDGSLILAVVNNDASSKTATLKAVADPDGRGGATVSDVAIVVPTLQIGLFPFMSPAMFNSGGNATVTLSATTSVKLGLYRLTKMR